MRQTRPDLIVPIRDRRRRVRILTLKNFGGLLLMLTIAFAGIELISRLHTRSENGRLLERRLESDAAVASRAPVVAAPVEPIEDQTSADIFRTDAAARAQYLGTPTQPQPSAVTPPEAPQPAAKVGSGDRVAIVGDGNQVAVVRGADARPKPQLSGGIFK